MTNIKDLFNENKGVFIIAVFTAVLASAIVANPTPVYATSDPFLGEIMYTGFNFAPRGWAQCDGQLLPINQNQSLFSLLGTIYGGDGRTTFALPDMRGRLLMDDGQGNGLTNKSLGQRGGTNTITLNLSQMPAHAHNVPPSLFENQLNATASMGSETTGTGNTLGASFARLYSNSIPNTSLHSDSLSITVEDETQILLTGGNQAHSNMPPYLTMSCNIALQGLFPSRN
jgi:microcystin-dependent protein